MIAPFVEDPEENRGYFQKLRQLAVDIGNKNIDNISMIIWWPRRKEPRSSESELVFSEKEIIVIQSRKRLNNKGDTQQWV